MTAPRLSPSDVQRALQAAALAQALQGVRHGNLQPPMEEPCAICARDAVIQWRLLAGIGWQLTPIPSNERT